MTDTPDTRAKLIADMSDELNRQRWASTATSPDTAFNQLRNWRDRLAALEASATPRPEGEILCPFCGHDERDRINMKRHLIVGCRAFGYTPFASVASRPPGAQP